MGKFVERMKWPHQVLADSKGPDQPAQADQTVCCSQIYSSTANENLVEITGRNTQST